MKGGTSEERQEGDGFSQMQTYPQSVGCILRYTKGAEQIVARLGHKPHL